MELESPHPYKTYRKKNLKVAIPHATSYEVSFDDRTATRKDKDFVRSVRCNDAAFVRGSLLVEMERTNFLSIASNTAPVK